MNRSDPPFRRLPALSCIALALALAACGDSKTNGSGSGGAGGAAGDAGHDAGGGGGHGDGGACTNDAKQCSATGVPQTCVDGAWRDQEACRQNEECRDGECKLPVVCEPNATRCQTELVLAVCNADGTAWEPTTCMGHCTDAGGMAHCDDVVCTPGENTCNGDQIVAKCSDDGTHYEFVMRCEGERTGEKCDHGECVPICELNKKTKTNVGCEYWAVDLDNALVPGGERGFLDAAGEQYAVVVSNPSPDLTATVTVLNNEMTVDSAPVPPLGLHIFNLPRRDVDGTVKAPLAYLVRSSIPIIAYQFNPLDNVDVFSNDASLLLPSHVLGKRYYVMTREQSFDSLRGYLTVVGINPDGTNVRVTVTAPTQAGTGDIPAMQPGDSYETTLQPFEVLNIETHAPGADLTGSLIEADQDVVVFGGSEASNAPNTNHCVDVDAETGMGVCEYKRDVPCHDNYDCNDANLNTCCADHLEEQLFPIDTWGTQYIGTKSFDRGLEDDYWRIIAAEDGTKVETIPPQADIPDLNAGEWFEFGSREHFEIVSNKPIMVGQFLASEQAPNPNLRNTTEDGDAGTGDPSFILAVPERQFRKDYVFLAPNKYAFDYASVIAPANAQVFFDQLPVPVSWEPVGDGSTWHIARFPIGDGVHFIEADQPVSVIVYGYDQYVSYGYPGGLNLDVDDEGMGGAQ